MGEGGGQVPSESFAVDPNDREGSMSDHIYKVIELVGSSKSNIEDAIKAAIERANRTVRNLRWFEVVQTRGCIESGDVIHYQVVLRAGFTLDESGGE
jgi:flavin-binding protein dodecin